MKFVSHAAVMLALLALPSGVRAGLYYSGEPMAEVPSQWRGFLLDQRTLRTLAVKPTARTPASPLHVKYAEAAAKLRQAREIRKLTADELADLGALEVRLGETARAVELLRSAQREHPLHFRIAANLGTAWLLQGDLHQAAATSEQPSRLAPGKLPKAEE